MALLLMELNNKKPIMGFLSLQHKLAYLMCCASVIVGALFNTPEYNL